MHPLRLAAVTLTLTLPLSLLGSPLAFAETVAPSLTVAGRPLDGASIVVGAVARIEVGSSNVQSVRWVLDGVYEGMDSTAPFELPLDVAAGGHRLKARVEASGVTTSYTAGFTMSSVTVTAPAPTPVVSPTPIAPLQPPPSPAADGAVTSVRVSTATQLTAAVAAAGPGTVIDLADGTYVGRFRATATGEASAPISLRGSRRAILSGGSTSSGYTLHLDGARFWVLDGFTVIGGQNGIVLDRTQRTVLRGLDVGRTGQEAVHFRSSSSDNTLADSLIHDTGLATAGYGEGVYIGSAVSNWDRYSGGAADRSDRNAVLRNRIWATTAESLDVKEGSSGGLIEGNSFDGSRISGANYADSWMDVKGNGYIVRRNTGMNSPMDGFQTHVVATGWGKNNAFVGNLLAVNGPGYGVNIQDPRGTGNLVACDNVATGAARGLSNAVCG